MQSIMQDKAQKGAADPFRVVAITGRSGSGKSTVTAHFKALGYPTMDADAVAHSVTQTDVACLAKLAKEFGADILDADGTLLRPVLAARAFETAEAAQRLTNITHPAIIARLLAGVETAKKNGAPLIFMDGAVIIGGAFAPYCDKFIVVAAEEKDAISRIVLRDGVSKQAARQRLAAQTPEAVLRSAADYVLENSSTQAALLQKADIVLAQLLPEGEP